MITHIVGVRHCHQTVIILTKLCMIRRGCMYMIHASWDEIPVHFSGILGIKWKLSWFYFVITWEMFHSVLLGSRFYHAGIHLPRDKILSSSRFSLFIQTKKTMFPINFHCKAKLERKSGIFSNHSFGCQPH